MKIEGLKSAHKNQSPIACFFRWMLICLVLSLSIGVTHGFAKDKKISGYVHTSSGNEISGVTITFSNGEGSTTTDSSGKYEQKVKEGWSGTATPSKVDFNFDPASRNYSNVKKDQKDQDYVGIQIQQPKTISGYVHTSSGNEISGVTITFSNGEGSTTTDSSGKYEQKVKEGWSGTATPSKVGFNFDPASRNYNEVEKNKKNQDYTGIVQTRAISGYVRTSSGNAFSGVTITFDNGGGTDTSNSSGYYSREVRYGWSGTVTPAKGGYSFVPVSRRYSNVTADQLNQDYTENAENRLFSVTINMVGSGNVKIAPDKNYYAKGSLITMTATAKSGWLFREWRGDLDSSDNPEKISINSDKTITAVFLADNDNDGVSNKEENAGPSNGDGNNDGILDSLQSNVSCLLIGNTTDYATLETPPGTSIKNCKAIIEPPNSNYPPDVEFLYGFFSFAVEGIGIGGSTSVTIYFPSDVTFNTYYKHGPTPDDPFDHWYEFIFDGQTGAEINKNNITLHFVDGKSGDDDLTENGKIIDLGGPGFNAAIFSETNSELDAGGDNSYGCFVGCLLEISVY